MKPFPSLHRMNRRSFLATAGAGALALGSPIAFAQRMPVRQRRFVISSDQFIRMFPDLPPFAPPSSALTAALNELGKPGGILDAKDALDRGPIDLITDLTLSEGNRNNVGQSAGTTFFGQFLDHDLTFDLSSRLGEPARLDRSRNERTPAFDLDSVYGGGPRDDPDLYEDLGRRMRFDARGPVLKLESGGLFEDLARSANGQAIIADPRNDENMIISGLQAAVISFHNRVATDLARRNTRMSPDQVFFEARRLTTWHYQWMIVHEVLPLFVGKAMVDALLPNGRRFFKPRNAAIPVEFQGAAYRFGHSLVRPSYRANLKGDNGNPFFGLIFDPSQENATDPTDLRGGRRASRRFIGWQTFFDFGDGEVRPNKRIDTKLSTPLFNLPLGTIATGDAPTSLPQRNLLRHVTWQLASGQAIAQTMGVPPLSAADLSELKGLGANLDTSTPLWYYILKEAAVMNDGLTLGPVGGRIVSEVFIGLLQMDRGSYLSDNPRWRPTLPDRSGKVSGEFRMVDFLTLAGVDPKSRGQ